MNTLEKAAIIAAGGGIIAMGGVWAYINSEVHAVNAPVIEPTGLVSVIMPTYNEEDYVERGLRSIVNQNIIRAYREKFELIVVDSQSVDKTVEIAEKYADKVINAPIGLLTARTTAIKQSRGDIILAVNADTYYPPNFANILLRNFRRNGVVGVSGIRIHEGPLAPLTILFYLLHSKLIMLGTNSAFLKSAFYEVGGWNLNIDQSNAIELQLEEEEIFARRLSQVGEVVFDPKAPAFTSPRRLYGKLKLNGTTFT
jgi:glycosyltransferase involved in cell wall biosynthesis